MGVVAYGDLRRAKDRTAMGYLDVPVLRAQASSAKAAFACQTRLESLIERSSDQAIARISQTEASTGSPPGRITGRHARQW